MAAAYKYIFQKIKGQGFYFYTTFGKAVTAQLPTDIMT